MKKEGSRIKINSKLRCCPNTPIRETVFDLGTEGERIWLLCSVHCKQKIFNMHIKSQKPIGDENGN